MDRENELIGLQEIIDKTLEEMAREAGDSFELDRLNLPEFHAEAVGQDRRVAGQAIVPNRGRNRPLHV